MREQLRAAVKKHLGLSERDTPQIRFFKLTLVGLIIVGFAAFGYYLGLVMGNFWATAN